MSGENLYIKPDYWRTGYTSGDGGAMVPLRKSWEATDLEAELKDLFISTYEEMLKGQDDFINVYGSPHLGSLDLVGRNIEMDGLSFIRTDDDQSIYYLFKAWRHLNPERGFHFMRTYIRALFGRSVDIQQLWQKKTDAYPTNLKPYGALESESDYFLTSRVRVDLDTNIVPDRIVRSMRTAAAARFVLDVRLVKYVLDEIGIASVGRAACIAHTEGETY